MRYVICFIKPKFKILIPVFAYLLFIGVLFAPMQYVHAWDLSSIFVGQVYADTNPIIQNPTLLDANSQTISLPQASISLASIIEEKDNAKGLSQSENIVNIVSDNALVPLTGPLGVSDGKDVVDPSSLETSVYIVRKGDSIALIAQMFNVSVNTILTANDIKKGDPIHEGDVLLILPISGIEHKVTNGQTLQSIAKLYSVDVEDIAFYNEINVGDKLAIGDELIIPDAEKSENEVIKPIQNKNPGKNVAGYFINPVPGSVKSRGVKPGHKGVDFAAPTGTPIYASGPGKILIARMGYNGGFGNYVVIQHPNGVKTLYAHMSKLSTTPGATVSQGDLIGYVGSTGRSTGPHTHFETIGAKNPF